MLMLIMMLMLMIMLRLMLMLIWDESLLLRLMVLISVTEDIEIHYFCLRSPHCELLGPYCVWAYPHTML